MRYQPPLAFADYLLTERIGVGGTAEIFRAVRRGRRPGDQPVALKRLLPHIAEDPDIVAILGREVGALERIDHPNVVRLLDHGTHRGLPYLVMELVDGRNLRDLLGPRSEQPGPRPVLPPAVALWITHEIACALAEAGSHGIIHRDVSPTNIQVTVDGDVKILDFGIARVRGLAQTTHGGAMRGKWAYCSPEQVEGLGLDPRSDLFALGSVLFEMIAGRPPFLGADRQETMGLVAAASYRGLGVVELEDADAPSWMPAVERVALELLLAQLLARHPAGRPADGGEVARRIASLLGASGVGSEFVAESGLYARWLGNVVGALGPVPSQLPAGAAEERGDTVTDPGGEGVTQVEGQSTPSTHEAPAVD